MRFWDSSGVVLLLTDQPGSQQARELFREDPAMVVWWGSAVECWSALARLRRDGALPPQAGAEAGRLLATLLQEAFEVQPSEELRRLAVRLLRVHPLRAADALQLAASRVPFRALRTTAFRIASCHANSGYWGISRKKRS